ncbi:methyltransferase domain-containing protein [soil metagenome]
MRSMHIKVIFLGALAMFAAGCTTQSTTTASNTATVPAVETPTPAATASPERKAGELDVPYVPTPQVVVDEMLRMAKVSGKDVLYDLGSGDGRIPITAAKRFGTRGVGIDLNPVRVEEANANAEKEKVTDKVKFIEGDIFTENFSEATVVTLYLLPAVNLRLKSTILDMKPGTRVVSHNYDMGDWTPEDSKKITTDDGVVHYVYFWTVPEKK